jgi:hypothetical protein
MIKKGEFKYKKYLWKKDLSKNKRKIYIAIALLAIAIYINYLAGIYTTKIPETNNVTDLVLDHIPAVNLGFIFSWGYLGFLIILTLYGVFYQPKKLHVAIIMFSLLILVRSISICLTHLAMPPEAIPVDFPGIAEKMRFQNDLFFSGHTSFPFLGFLIFKGKGIRTFTLIATIVMASTVLLMHQHYSIDVFAAFFITYGVYQFGRRIFKEKLS